MITATIQTSKGSIDFTLFEQDAPKTVEHFRNLAEKGFYNGLEFFKYESDLLIQTGCPRNDGTGHPGYFIKCELKNNVRRHDFGVLSMAHTARNANGSQFFICLGRNLSDDFDLNNTCFGKMSKGFDILPKLRMGDTVVKITVKEVASK